jgi:integral membrane sensor domain MASE1
VSREQRQDEEKEGRRSLNDIVLRAGAIATALGAIIGLVTVLWPDSPARLVATLDRLEIDKAVALSELQPASVSLTRERIQASEQRGTMERSPRSPRLI